MAPKPRPQKGFRKGTPIIVSRPAEFQWLGIPEIVHYSLYEGLERRGNSSNRRKPSPRKLLAYQKMVSEIKKGRRSRIFRRFNALGEWERGLPEQMHNHIEMQIRLAREEIKKTKLKGNNAIKKCCVA